MNAFRARKIANYIHSMYVGRRWPSKNPSIELQHRNPTVSQEPAPNRSSPTYRNFLYIPESGVPELRAMQETTEHPQRQSDPSGVAQGFKDVVAQPLEHLNPLKATTKKGSKGDDKTIATEMVDSAGTAVSIGW